MYLTKYLLGTTTNHIMLFFRRIITKNNSHTISNHLVSHIVKNSLGGGTAKLYLKEILRGYQTS